ELDMFLGLGHSLHRHRVVVVRQTGWPRFAPARSPRRAPRRAFRTGRPEGRSAAFLCVLPTIRSFTTVPPRTCAALGARAGRCRIPTRLDLVRSPRLERGGGGDHFYGPGNTCGDRDK